MGQTRQQPRHPSSQEQQVSEEEILLAMAGLLAAGAGAAAGGALVAQLADALGMLLPDLPRPVLTGAARLAAQELPPTPKPRSGVARRNADRENLLRRAQYAVNAAKRLGSIVVEGEPLADALVAERRNFGLHKEASERRRKAGSLNDVAADNFGPVLGWYSVRDEVTTPECAEADRKNFRVDKPPRIGYPGTLHGGTCRCSPGAPFPGAEVMR